MNGLLHELLKGVLDDSRNVFGIILEFGFNSFQLRYLWLSALKLLLEGINLRFIVLNYFIKINVFLFEALKAERVLGIVLGQWELVALGCLSLLIFIFADTSLFFLIKTTLLGTFWFLLLFRQLRDSFHQLCLFFVRIFELFVEAGEVGCFNIEFILVVDDWLRLAQ